MIRRWRWWLLLPLALVLVAVASASRLHVFWWPDQRHDATTGVQGRPVEVADAWQDGAGRTHRRELTLTVLEVAPATRVRTYSGLEPVPAPPGTVVWEVRLRFAVDPDVPLGGCKVSLVDRRGREATATGATLGEVMLPLPACTPDDARGPDYAGEEDPNAPPRPPEYDVTAYVLTDLDGTPDKVRVWWEPPDYVEVDVEVDAEVDTGGRA